MKLTLRNVVGKRFFNWLSQSTNEGTSEFKKSHFLTFYIIDVYKVSAVLPNHKLMTRSRVSIPDHQLR